MVILLILLAAFAFSLYVVVPKPVEVSEAAWVYADQREIFSAKLLLKAKPTNKLCPHLRSIRFD